MFAVGGFAWLVMIFKTRSGTEFHGCTFHQCSAETNLTLICPSTKTFVCTLPDSGSHVTRPSQGLLTGRRENLGLRFVFPVCKYLFVWIIICIAHFGLVSASSVTSCSICISSSWCTLCFIQVLFIICLIKKFLYHRWTTSKFLQCKWPIKANTVTLDSKLSGYKSSPGSPSLEHCQILNCE